MKKAMPKVVQALLSLIENDRFKNPETNVIDVSKITYTDAIKAFTDLRVDEGDIFSDVRDIVMAEIAFGIAQRLNDGGPANPENTLRYEGLTALLKLWRETVACQADLEEEQRRERARLRESIQEDDDVEPEEDQGVAGDRDR